MELIIDILLFNIFYHIAYILTFDVIKYHIKNNIKPYKNLYKQIIYAIILPILVFLILPIILKLMKEPFILRSATFFLIGLILTRDVWGMYLTKMKNYKDSYYYKYYKMDPFYLKNLTKSSPKFIANDHLKKIEEITNFINNYPYQIEIKRANFINAYADLRNKKIVITSACLNIPVGELKAMLGHKIMHFYVDGKITEKRRKINFFITLYLIFSHFFPYHLYYKIHGQLLSL